MNVRQLKKLGFRGAAAEGTKWVTLSPSCIHCAHELTGPDCPRRRHRHGETIGDYDLNKMVIPYSVFGYLTTLSQSSGTTFKA